jgi:FdrA protein
VLGLFSGGSLAHEAVTILETAIGPVAGNVSGREESAGGHRILDLGEADYTRGRPHPMVDLDVRVGMLEEAAGDERVGCVLLDVVLGHGAHPDPAGELAAPLARVAERALVLARVCGTDEDPQDARAQTATLEEAGALVAPSNAAAARLAVRAVRPA